MAELSRFQGIPGQAPRIRNISADELRRLFEAPEIQKPGLTTSDAVALTSALETRRMNDLQQKQKVAEIERKIAEAEAAKRQNEQIGTALQPLLPEEKRPLGQSLASGGKIDEALELMAKPKESTPELQLKGTTQTGLPVSYNKGTGNFELPGGEIYSESKHGALQPTVDPTMANAAIKDITSLAQARNQLMRVKDLVTPRKGEDLEAVGVIEGRLQDFAINTGIQIPGLRDLTEITDKKMQMRTVLQSSINDYIKAITGAQMSEPEALRIMKALPNRNADDRAFLPTINEIIKITEEKIESQRKAYKAAGFRNVDSIFEAVAPGLQESSGKSMTREEKKAAILRKLQGAR